VDDSLEIPSSLLFNRMISNFTWSAWIQADSQAGSTNPILEFGDTVLSMDAGGSVKTWLNTGARSDIIESDAAIDTNRWHHLVLRWNGAHAQLTIDNLLQQDSAVVSGNLSLGHAITLGGHKDGNHYQGLIDQVEIYDRALSVAEITALWNAGSGTAELPGTMILGGNQTVDYATQSYTVSGTNNAHVVGAMSWTNQRTTLTGALPATSSWSIPNVALEVGENLVIVSGSNSTGNVSSDRVTITRQTRLPNEVAWWYQRDVLIAEGSDYNAVNAGQLKWAAFQTYQEFEVELSGGAGTGVVVLVNSLANSNNYDMVNQGQLKAVAKPFYDRLWELGMTNAYPPGVTNRYPWSGVTNAPDYAPANAGQLKQLFRFEFE